MLLSNRDEKASIKSEAIGKQNSNNIILQCHLTTRWQVLRKKTKKCGRPSLFTRILTHPRRFSFCTEIDHGTRFHEE